MPFQPAQNTQTALKAGFLGFNSAGKTFTASEVAIGLVKYLRERKIPGSEKPAFFIDSETGSDYVMDRFKEAGVELQVSKTRAFTDLISDSRVAERDGSVLLIDSATHFWREFVEAYKKKRNISRIDFSDWDYLKGSDGWGKFTDFFVNSPLHMIVCGRAGYEYDFEEDERGKKQLVKTGIKMKVEGEFGFEPSLLVLMERVEVMEGGSLKETYREGNIMKDRFDLIDGKTFKNPSFADFRPHIERLNLGGKHMGFDASRNSSLSIDTEGKPQWKREKEQKAVVLDEILEQLRKHHPGTSEAVRGEKSALLEKLCGTRSWSKIEAEFSLDQAKKLRNDLWVQTEGVPYAYKEPAAATGDLDLGNDIPG